MKKNSEHAKFLFISLCLVFFSFFIPQNFSSKVFSGINDLSVQFAYGFSRKHVKSLKIVGIGIDDYSLNRINQSWPWNRSLYARIIKILDKERTKVIGIDFFSIGESENKNDDLALKDALNSVASRTVLGSVFDYKKGEAVLPLGGLKDSFKQLGIFNTPKDIDGKVRRFRGYVEFKGNVYYSFPVMLSAAFLNQSPKNIIFSLPLLKDKSCFINYLLKPKDIVTISFYDVLENLEELKKKYGEHFLKDALVLIYPEATIFHDTHLTPFGQMAGGFVNINGVATILSGRFIKQLDALSLIFFILTLSAISIILGYTGFAAGFMLTLGVLLLGFWSFILLHLIGIKLDFSRIVIFGFLLFAMGSLIKYSNFLKKLIRIKDKATFDPLRKLFTLRYFYYRLEPELNKFYFGKDLFLVIISLESLKKISENISLEKIKNLWHGISLCLGKLKKSFWSVYSPEEIVGCVWVAPSESDASIKDLKYNLDALLDKEAKLKVKLGYVKIKKGYPIKGLLFILFNELRKKEVCTVLFNEKDFLADVSKPSYINAQETAQFIESLDEDIEDKNKQLLLLVENLIKEHGKIKDAFFQIIASLVNALEARDAYTQGHSQRVCKYSLMLADRLGWDKEQREKLEKAAVLHDIGKIGIPDHILHKKGSLDPQEWEIIRKHEVIGVKILEPLKEINDILPWIMYHHERWDGKGYPHGLRGEDVPEGAQIIALSDVFDALTTGRDYKVAMSREDSLKEIIRGKGTQFNPQLTDIFVEIVGEAQK